MSRLLSLALISVGVCSTQLTMTDKLAESCQDSMQYTIFQYTSMGQGYKSRSGYLFITSTSSLQDLTQSILYST